MLTENQFQQYLINRIKKFYLSKTNEPSGASSNQVETTANRTYIKLPYIGTYSSITQKKQRNIIHSYCNNTEIELVFSAFKISELFSNKVKVPNSLKSHVIYLFECAGCKARYIGETNRHLRTRINEHLNFRTNINALQSTRNKAMICKRNKFINRTNVSLRLATSSEYE